VLIASRAFVCRCDTHGGVRELGQQEAGINQMCIHIHVEPCHGSLCDVWTCGVCPLLTLWFISSSHVVNVISELGCLVC
jgi:hypothetical protein